MTPREVALALEAAAWQAQREQEKMLALAWHVAALQRAKPLPSLRSLLRPRQAKKRVPVSERRREFAELKEIVHAHRTGRSTDTDPGDAG